MIPDFVLDGYWCVFAGDPRTAYPAALLVLKPDAKALSECYPQQRLLTYRQWREQFQPVKIEEPAR